MITGRNYGIFHEVISGKKCLQGPSRICSEANSQKKKMKITFLNQSSKAKKIGGDHARYVVVISVALFALSLVVFLKILCSKLASIHHVSKCILLSNFKRMGR